MKFFWILLVAVLVGVGGWFGWRQVQRNKAEAPGARPIATAKVEARDISFTVSAAGDIGPADQVSVRPEINGRIAELPVDIGDKVKNDQLLCRLDDKELQTEKESSLAEVTGANLQIISSKLNQEKAALDFERSKELFTGKLISKEEYDHAKNLLEVMQNNIQLASNSLDRAQKALRQVDERLSKTRIRAPFDCTVLTRPVSLGQTVSGAAGFNSGTEVMTVANLKEMIVSAHINQADVTRLQVNQEVDIQVESIPGLRMRGQIERIAPQAVIKNGIKGFGVRVALKELDPRARTGMTAILEIPVASAENVLSVPLSAVFSERGERYVYVKKGEEEWERRTVDVGIADFSYAEIQKGLAGEEVVALELPPSERGQLTGKMPPKDTAKPAKRPKTAVPTVAHAGDKPGERPVTAVQPPTNSTNKVRL